AFGVSVATCVPGAYARVAGTAVAPGPVTNTVEPVIVAAFIISLNVALIVGAGPTVEPLAGATAVTLGGVRSRPAGRISTMLRLYGSPAGAVSLMVTFVPGVGVVPLVRCTQNVSGTPATYW